MSLWLKAKGHCYFNHKTVRLLCEEVEVERGI